MIVKQNLMTIHHILTTGDDSFSKDHICWPVYQIMCGVSKGILRLYSDCIYV